VALKTAVVLRITSSNANSFLHFKVIVAISFLHFFNMIDAVTRVNIVSNGYKNVNAKNATVTNMAIGMNRVPNMIKSLASSKTLVGKGS